MSFQTFAFNLILALVSRLTTSLLNVDVLKEWCLTSTIELVSVTTFSPIKIVYLEPAPKNMCKNMVGCVCESINDNQMSCTCRPSGEKCFLEKGPPRIFLHPTPPYQVEPGSSLNITCSGVGYPFPQVSWRS